jgi:hypothetical protein
MISTPGTMWQLRRLVQLLWITATTTSSAMCVGVDSATSTPSLALSTLLYARQVFPHTANDRECRIKMEHCFKQPQKSPNFIYTKN